MKPSNPKNDDLENRLRFDAARIQPLPPEGMNERIVRATRHAETPAPQFRRLSGGFLAALGAIGAAAALAVVFSARHAGGPPSEPAPVPALVWTSVQPKATALLEQDPLRADATALYSDARSAASFLAINFLPSSPPPSHSAPPGQG
jgi:hypothetical protein